MNGTLIIGPTSGDAAYIEFDNINFLNVGDTYPIENNLNLYVGSFTGDNPTGYEVSWNSNMNAEGNGNAQMVGKAAFNTAATEASDCAPAFTPGTPVIITNENPIYSYAFEDTKLGDYDLNDVVIKVQENEDGEHLDLKVVASGATLNLNIRLYPAATVPEGVVAVYPEAQEGYEVLTYTRDGQECDEVHAMLGVDPGTMVNTGWGNNKALPITIQILKGDYDPAHLPLAIYSVAQGEVRLSGSGTAPYGVVIPKNWSWPYETRKVHNIYNATQTANDGDQSFQTFSSQAGQAESWYDHPTGDVLNETTLGF